MEHRIRRLAGWLGRGSTLGIVVLPLGVAGAVATGTMEVPLPPGAALGEGERALSLAVGMVPVALAMWVLWIARDLFELCRRARVLSEEAARAVGRIGAVLVALAGAGLVVPTVQTLIVTWDEGPGGRVLAITLGSGEFGLLLAGGLMTVLGAAMRDGAAAVRENAGFV